MNAVALILSIPVLFSVLLALRFRLPTVLGFFVPTAVIADPYFSAATLVACLLVRLLPGREPIATDGLVPLSLLSVLWLGAALILIPASGSAFRWLTEVIQLGIGLLALLILRASVLNQRDLRLVAIGFFAAAVVLSIYSVSRGLTGVSLNTRSLISPHPANYAALVILFGLLTFASGLTSAYSRRHAPVTVLMSVFLLLGIYYNESRASLAVGLLSLALLSVLRGRLLAALTVFRVTAIAIIVVAAAAGVVVVMPDLLISQMFASTVDFGGRNFSNMERVFLLLQSIELFQSQPMGHGVGSTSNLFSVSLLTQESYPHPHNTLAMFAVELGVIGIVIYALILSALFTAFRQGIQGVHNRPEFVTRFMLVAPVAFGLATVYEAIFFSGTLALMCYLFLGFIFVVSGSTEVVGAVQRKVSNSMLHSPS